MKLSVSVMAHPARAGWVPELVSRLPGATVVWDDDKPPSADPRRRWAVGRRAWEAFDPEADWHLVTQDDALVCGDAVAGLERALDVLGPSGLVSAYAGSGRPSQKHLKAAIDRADVHGDSWFATRSLNWGVAIVAPVYTIPDMLDWCSKRGNDTKNYDFRIGLYYRDVLKWKTWYTLPSLIDHRDEKSLVGHDGVPRVAHRFCSGSGLEVDWSRVPEGGLTPFLDRK